MYLSNIASTLRFDLVSEYRGIILVNLSLLFCCFVFKQFSE